MNAQQIAILAGAIRTIFAAALGVVVAKYIPGDVLNIILLAVGQLVLCGWSIAQKADNALGLLPMIAGAARNLLTTALTYAASRGWIGADQIAAIVAATGTIAMMAWSAWQKAVTVSK